MVKVVGPMLSMAYSPLLRKPRRHYGAAPLPAPPPPPVTETFIAEAHDVPPEQDCSGTYEYFQDLNDRPCYRRLPAFDFFIYWNQLEYWTINEFIKDGEAFGWDSSSATPAGFYNALDLGHVGWVQVTGPYT